ncbi:translesion DNA synthesis-associated protein ImuA [uncultured Comamonas sp.]|uniref:translesion DNA synthesis-associated protein ImuA n=1 Tax=uncultured Comamonas sp. TaxID=114710 RepID=UPI0025E0AC3A|nr:translesion DNA synthesis-associated protein ImuA [uncultured Comamonas sp.]
MNESARQQAGAAKSMQAGLPAGGSPGLSEIRIPGVWRGTDWRLEASPKVWPSGHAALDCELPGGGWPGNALIQLQQPAHCHAEWALLLPALAARVRQHAASLGDSRMGQLVLVAPPYLPFAPALQAAGIDAKRLCAVQPGRSAQDLAWACEQALHCRDVLAVLAWLPELPASTLRRLQLAAASQGRPLWLWQALQGESHSSPAALRLRLERVAADSAAQQAPGLRIQILKRRGPVLERPIQLALSQWAWQPVLQAQTQRHARQSEEAAMLMQGRMTAAASAKASPRMTEA